MLDVVIRVAAGIAGAAIFAAMNNYFFMLSTGYWYLGGAIVFVVFFAIAYLVQRLSKSRLQDDPRLIVASKNKSGGKMEVTVAGVPPSQNGASLLGSENESSGDMAVSVKNKSQP